MFLSMAYTSKQKQETNAKHNKAAALFQIALLVLNVPLRKSMSVYNRLVAMHGESRPMFILVTEFIAFTGTMAAILGIGFIRDWLL